MSSSILVLQDGRVAVVNPDQGSVSFSDPDTLATQSTVAVGGDPRALLQLHTGMLWVATNHGGEVVAISPATGAVTGKAALCAGPNSLAESPDGTWVAVACEWNGTVLRLNPPSMVPTTLATGLKRPRGLAVVGTSVVVAEFTGGDVVEITSTGKTSRVALVPTTAPYRPALTQLTANLAGAVVPAFGYLFVTHELVDHTGSVTGETVADDYGTVLNGTPKINAAATRLLLEGDVASDASDTPPVYSRFDMPQHSFSGAVAAASFGTHNLLVAHLSTNDVAVLDTTATDPNNRLVGSYQVGAGPAGIAVDPAHSIAYIDNSLDGSISRIDLTQPLSTSGPVYPATATLGRGLPSPYSEPALDGRRLFHDATNPHVTPSRVVSCATCHPGGNDDGLVWFMNTPAIPLKRRRSPDLANSHTGTAPFHWNGQFASIPDLVAATVTGLMAGDDLLVDGTTVQAYLDEIVQKPVAPPQDPAAVARGQALFQSPGTGCATCHTGPYMTDDLMHAPLNPMTLEADDVITLTNTPGLFGLFDRAPYFHDGRAPDLTNLLTRPDAANHGHTAGLSASEISDLVAYLESL